jgi:REP element-mobilizing transposase RayT
MMPRQVRIEFAGAMYHVMARGNRREAIVKDDQDRLTFLRTLGEACERTGFRVHAYVLMTNHYHLLVETPQPNLSRGMGWMQNAYTRRMNTRHGLWGHLFGGRYKAIVVEPGNCFWALMDYIHLNPVRAGMVKEPDGLESYPWSSVKNYIAPARSRPVWLETAMGFSVCGCEDSAAGRKEYLEVLERRVDWKHPTKAGAVYSEGEGRPELAVQSTLRRGWVFGSQSFREKLLKLASGKLRERAGKKFDGYHGEEVRDHGEHRAQAIVQAGCAHFQTTPSELRCGRKNDWRKCLVAELIQAETTMRLDWISEVLGMGSRGWCCNQIRQTRVLLGKDRSLRKKRDELMHAIKND